MLLIKLREIRNYYLALNLLEEKLEKKELFSREIRVFSVPAKKTIIRVYTN